ncbi:hypothetical protein AB6A40_010114 [Gnathostoma spinigerum]|uniref:Uncharacterized protein n=1 Tax=Gnathostoma spinigerum TaxID=75299 RepID=A0ABD6ETV3_9BILA
MVMKLFITVAFLLLVGTYCQRPLTLCDDWKMPKQHAELAVALFKDVAGKKTDSSVVSPASYLAAEYFLILLAWANFKEQYGGGRYDQMTAFLRSCSGGSDLEWSQRFYAHPKLGPDMYRSPFLRWMEKVQHFDVLFPFSPHVPYYVSSIAIS